MDPAASTPDTAYPLIGQIVGGRYHIVGLIGEGGMGIVYKAEQRLGSTLRKVAVKTLHAELSRDPSITARFHREVGTVAQLEHPNTVRVYDFGSTDDGTLYIAMEFLDGKALNRVIESDGAIEPKRVGHLLRQVAGSLDEAHRQGIVHRDLKPENVLLIERAGEKDVVKLVDFGIAARTESAAENAKEQKLTQQGMVLGTPPYMSPEQFTGKPLDARSDVYSLGVMVYEMLTGQLPFQAETAWQWASHHMTSPPRSFEETSAGRNLPEALRRTVLKALSKEPAERQGSAGQFYTEFVASLGSASIAAPKMQPVAAGKTEAMPQATPLAMAATEGMAAVELRAAPPAPAPAIPSPVGLPPAPPREAASGNNKALVYGLSGLGGVLLIAMGVVALTSGRRSGDTAPIDLTPPVTSTAPASSGEPTAVEPPPEPEPKPAPEPEKPATTTRPVSTKPAQPAPSPSRPTPAPSGTSSSGGAPAAPSVPPTTSAPPAPVVTPPVSTPPPQQQPAPPVTQPKPPAAQPAPAGDACAACAAAAKGGDFVGAARAYAQCTNADQKKGCQARVAQAAPNAATYAARNGKCDQARLIIEAAIQMDVPRQKLAKAAQDCK